MDRASFCPHMNSFQRITLVFSALLSVGIVETSSADGTIQPFHADPIKPVQGATIEPFHAKPIEAIQGNAVQPEKSRALTNRNEGAVIKPERGSGTIEPFHAQPMKRMKPAGIDPAPVQAPLDRRLVGTWDVSIPGVAYQTETDRGPYVERKLHVGTGAGLGVLTISRAGEFRWKRNGETSKGKLQQVIPHNFADPKQTYWRLQQGKDVYYISAESPGEITFYSPGSNLFAASGKRRAVEKKQK